MNTINTVKTKKGTELPLTNLKGKDYLMVAYRLQWLTEDQAKYTIDTLTIDRNDKKATVQATICLFGEDGSLTRRAVARKTEHAGDFGDFEEKAETGAIGRALAMLGYGTQHAVSDLDEGARIVDSPVVNTKTANKTVPVATTSPSQVATNAGSVPPQTSSAATNTSSAPRRSTSFNRRATVAPVATEASKPALPTNQKPVPAPAVTVDEWT